jgi:hypothetical protein
MNIPAPKSGGNTTSFKAGFNTQKNSIKTASLKASSVASAQGSENSKESNSEQNGNGDVAKAQKEQARTFAQTRPGSNAKLAKKVTKSALQGGKPGSQDILNAAKKGRQDESKSPGSGYNKINSARNAANESATWQAHLKGSAETAKALADGLAKLGQGLGQIGASVAKMAEKKAGGSGSESAGGEQQQQQAAQEQQIAQNDAQAQGGGVQNA